MLRSILFTPLAILMISTSFQTQAIEFDELGHVAVKSATKCFDQNNVDQLVRSLNQSNDPEDEQVILAKISGMAGHRTRSEEQANTPHLHVVTAFDENYAPHAAATFSSALIARYGATTKITFHVMEEPREAKQLSSTTRNKLQNILDRFGRGLANIEFLTFDESLLSQGLYSVYMGQIRGGAGSYSSLSVTDSQESDFSHGPVFMTWPLSIMYKIFIPEVFSKYFGQDEHRVMWLDTDTVVLQDLSEMFKTPFGESQTISGVMDPFAYDQKTRHLGLSTNDVYINAGVIGFNPQLDLVSYTKSIKHWVSKGYSALFPEQDLLSGSQAGHIQQLSGQWNQFGYDTTSPDWNEFAHLPSIIHFAGSKPWKLSDSSLWHTVPNQYNSFEALYWTYRSLGGFVPEEIQNTNDSSAQNTSQLYNIKLSQGSSVDNEV